MEGTLDEYAFIDVPTMNGQPVQAWQVDDQVAPEMSHGEAAELKRMVDSGFRKFCKRHGMQERMEYTPGQRRDMEIAEVRAARAKRALGRATE